MIVVAVIGILVAIAYPNYQEHVKSGKRGEAKSDLVTLAQFMERYYTENTKYSGAALPFTQSPQTGTAMYTIALNPAPAAETYTIVATGVGMMANDKCNNLTINQAGVKGGNSGCW
jgi:type IV pilus assembly protein PilE